MSDHNESASDPLDALEPYLAPYRGRWVALIKGQVAGVGQTGQDARLAARHSRPRERIDEIRYIPGDFSPEENQPVSQHAGLAQAVAATFSEGSLAAQVLTWLKGLEQPVHIVGGSVRDLLLDRPTHDLDLAVSHDALPLARRLADALGGAFVPLDVERQTARGVLADPTGEPFNVDFALWRADTLAGDLLLRDFTINALALDVHRLDDGLIDVTGGLDDLDRRLLRVASDRSLTDDPLRGLRAIRLLAELAPLGFRLESDTRRQLAQQAGLLTRCSAERIRDELVRIVAADAPHSWLRLLADLGQLRVVLPEADALRGVAQSPPHRWDVFEHTRRAVERIAWQQRWLAGQAALEAWPEEAFDQALAPYRQRLADHLAAGESSQRSHSQMLRWAALCHDWGKPDTASLEKKEAGPARIRFFNHEQAGAELTAQALNRLRFNRAEVRRVATIVTHHMRPLHLAASRGPISRRAIFRYFRDLGDAGLDVALLSLADQRATYGPALEEARWRRCLAVASRLLQDYFEHHAQAIAPEPLVSGHDLIAAFDLAPGKLIGRLLADLAEAQAADEVRTRSQALAYAESLLSRY